MQHPLQTDDPIDRLVQLGEGDPAEGAVEDRSGVPRPRRRSRSDLGAAAPARTATSPAVAAPRRWAPSWRGSRCRAHPAAPAGGPPSRPCPRPPTPATITMTERLAWPAPTALGAGPRRPGPLPLVGRLIDPVTQFCVLEHGAPDSEPGRRGPSADTRGEGARGRCPPPRQAYQGRGSLAPGACQPDLDPSGRHLGVFLLLGRSRARCRSPFPDSRRTVHAPFKAHGSPSVGHSQQ